MSDFSVVQFNEELGNNQADAPNFAGVPFVGQQTSVKEFNIASTTGEGYMQLSVAGMQDPNAQVFVNGTELPGQNFDPIISTNSFVTSLVHIHAGLKSGKNTIQFKSAPGNIDNWVINHAVIHWQ